MKVRHSIPSTGKCSDSGAIVMQQLRGLAARAPYFSNGSAATLRDVVEFYDRRYAIGYSKTKSRISSTSSGLSDTAARYTKKYPD